VVCPVRAAGEPAVLVVVEADGFAVDVTGAEPPAFFVVDERALAVLRIDNAHQWVNFNSRNSANREDQLTGDSAKLAGHLHRSTRIGRSYHQLSERHQAQQEDQTVPHAQRLQSRCSHEPHRLPKDRCTNLSVLELPVVPAYLVDSSNSQLCPPLPRP
jgi:hypothetical protein